MQMQMRKQKFLIWVITLIFWGVFFYSMTIRGRPAAIELLILILAISFTGMSIILSLRPW